MVGINFYRPVGPYSDTRELEYIAALHQTSEELRQDGTIDALDIMHFLSSRHGIRVSEEIVTESIVLQLAGSFPPPTPKTTVVEDKFLDETTSTIRLDTSGGGGAGGGKESPDLELQQGLLATTKPTTTKETIREDDDSDKEDEEEEEPPPTTKIDLCQILALLLIPFLRTGELDSGFGGGGGLGGGLGNMFLGLNKQRSRRKQRADEEEQPQQHRANQELIRQVLRIALNNLLSEIDDINGESPPLKRTDTGIWLTLDVLREILETFGEFNVPTTLLEEMMDVALKGSDACHSVNSSGGEEPIRVYFDQTLFLHVLTADTQLYDPTNIDTKSSTHYEDARKAQQHQQQVMYGKMAGNRRTTILKRNQQVDTNTNALHFQEVYTAANIDNNSDNYRSTGWFTLVWVEAVLLYFAYLLNTDWDAEEVLTNCTHEYGCAIAVSLINWIVIFLELMCMGLTWVFIATLGNATNPTEECSQKLYTTLRIMLGIALVTFINKVTFFQEDESYFWNTTKNQTNEPAYWTAFVIGCLIIGFQLLRLIGIYVDLGPIGHSGMEQKERCIKMAAVCKVRKIVEHATLLHDNKLLLAHKSESNNDNNARGQKDHWSSKNSNVSTVLLESMRSSIKQANGGSSYLEDNKKEQSKQGGSTVSKALMSYHKLQDTKEEVGGILWAYRGLWNGTLFKQEGIFLHGRLLAVNATQFFIVSLMVAIFFVYLGRIERILEGVDDHCTVRVEDLNSPSPMIDLDYNETVDGFVNIFNVNSTHFSPDDGYTYIEGQFPKYNGSHFNTPNRDGTVCYGTQVAGLERPPHGPPPRNDTNATGWLTNMTMADWDWFNGTAIMEGFEFGEEGGPPPPEGQEGQGPPGEGQPPPEGGGTGGIVDTGSSTVDSAIGAISGLLTGETTTMEDPGEQNGGGGDMGPPPADGGGMMPFDFFGNVSDITASISTRLVVNPGATQNQYLALMDIQPWEYKVSLAMGLVGAFLGTLSIALAYIPSFISSVLKMRSGVMPSLKGDQITYFRFRKAPDQTAILFGTNFWGCFFTAASCFILFGIVTFVCVYSKSREYIITISSAFIGMGATIGIKVIVMLILRSTFYSGYYRKRPAAANIMNVVLECWSLGLSVGTIATRMAQLLVVTAFYVGRIDTPMLAPGVGNIMGAPLDPSPDAFKKDLLIHEAHRHPYIERLGLLYLLKLHNGKDFGTRAGAYWRLLFVLALMPWMRNYRVRTDLDVDVDDDYENDNDNNDDGEDLGLLDNVKRNKRKRKSIFERYDKVGALIVQEEDSKNKRKGRIPNPDHDGLQGFHPSEMDQALLVNARLMEQNRNLMAALRAAREELAKANIAMDPKQEQEQLRALQAPSAVTSTYWGVRLLGTDFPGRLVLSRLGLAYYTNSDEGAAAAVKIRWKDLAKNERNSESSSYNLLRLTSRDGQRYDFLVRSKADRASIRQEIAARMEDYQYNDT